MAADVTKRLWEMKNVVERLEGGIMKWEYRVALFRWRSDVWQEVNNMTDELNRLGHEGWEVVGLSYAEFSGQIVILKRPAVTNR
jgi:hypothetical protein